MVSRLPGFPAMAPRGCQLPVSAAWSADRSNASRFYAGVPGGAGGGMLAGVYRSDDGGVTWTAVNAGLSGLETSFRILLTVHSGSAFGANAVYAAVLAGDRTLSGVFRSANQGGSWSPEVPLPEIRVNVTPLSVLR